MLKPINDVTASINGLVLRGRWFKFPYHILSDDLRLYKANIRLSDLKLYVSRGYNIGVRLVDEFLAKSNVSRCVDFKETAEVIAKVCLSWHKKSKCIGLSGYGTYLRFLTAMLVVLFLFSSIKF